LREIGYVEGQNVVIEYRSAENDPDRLTALATDFARQPVAVIVGNFLSAIAAKAVTATVPIVFATGSDPVRDGLVSSLNRPGGNVTGVSFSLNGLERSDWNSYANWFPRRRPLPCSRAQVPTPRRNDRTWRQPRR
jgi:putative ABC transport system substrate-binding protein